MRVGPADTHIQRGAEMQMFTHLENGSNFHMQFQTVFTDLIIREDQSGTDIDIQGMEGMEVQQPGHGMVGVFAENEFVSGPDPHPLGESEEGMDVKGISPGRLIWEVYRSGTHTEFVVLVMMIIMVGPRFLLSE